jgi:hypothetical protein
VEVAVEVVSTSSLRLPLRRGELRVRRIGAEGPPGPTGKSRP